MIWRAGRNALSAGGPVDGATAARRAATQSLAYLDVPALGQPEAFIHAQEGLFDADGNIGESSKNFLQTWMDADVAWVKKHSA